MTNISVEEKEGAVVLSIIGEITMETANEVENNCSKYLNSGLRVLAFDLHGVMFIDSFGLSIIIKHSKNFISRGTDFVLVDMNDKIRQIFKISTFDRIFTIMTRDQFDEKYSDN